jgi:hypothetical protein
MIEYLYDTIRAVAGQEINVAAKVKDDSGNLITDGCAFVLYTPGDMASFDGTYYEDVKTWQFTIPAEATVGMSGRYFYCIQRNGENLCFKTPIYLV